MMVRLAYSMPEKCPDRGTDKGVDRVRGEFAAPRNARLTAKVADGKDQLFADSAGPCPPIARA